MPENALIFKKKLPENNACPGYGKWRNIKTRTQASRTIHTTQTSEDHRANTGRRPPLSMQADDVRSSADQDRDRAEASGHVPAAGPTPPKDGLAINYLTPPPPNVKPHCPPTAPPLRLNTITIPFCGSAGRRVSGAGRGKPRKLIIQSKVVHLTLLAPKTVTRWELSN